jgi:hypothetical protein
VEYVLTDLRGGDVVSHDKHAVAHEHRHVDVHHALGFELSQ